MACDKSARVCIALLCSVDRTLLAPAKMYERESCLQSPVLFPQNSSASLVQVTLRSPGRTLRNLKNHGQCLVGLESMAIKYQVQLSSHVCSASQNHLVSCVMQSGYVQRVHVDC